MTTIHHVLLVAAAVAAAASAQGPDMLVTYSQTEQTLSGSGGTVLRVLRPNEICHLEWSTGPCASPSAEKFAPRTCFHVMAGDENGDGVYWNPTLFGPIDALCAPIGTAPAIAGVNARSVFFSPSVAMGTNVSGGPGLRPGDVGHIVRNAAFQDGQVEYFMRQEQFNQALGLPLTTPIDVDAICFQPGLGVYFSLDQDITATNFCGATFIQDGAIVCVPDWAITWTADFRVASVLPNSSAVVHTEAAIDAMVANAQVTDRLGNCLTQAIDLEALEFDWNGPTGMSFPCPGTVVQAPHFIFTVETGTGASVLTTIGGGTIYNHMCGQAGRGCGGGPTFGPQMGIQPTSATVGAPSYVNALMATFTTRFVLEAQQHVVTAPGGAPLGATMIDYRSPYAWNLAFIELVNPFVPPSLPAFPFSQLCFPDLYTPSLIVHWWPIAGQWGSFPATGFPAGFSGKILYQALGFGGSGFELSTPTVVDIN
jgi:hypothetical protein